MVQIYITDVDYVTSKFTRLTCDRNARYQRSAVCSSTKQVPFINRWNRESVLKLNMTVFFNLNKFMEVA